MEFVSSNQLNNKFSKRMCSNHWPIQLAWLEIRSSVETEPYAKTKLVRLTKSHLWANKIRVQKHRTRESKLNKPQSSNLKDRCKLLPQWRSQIYLIQLQTQLASHTNRARSQRRLSLKVCKSELNCQSWVNHPEHILNILLRCTRTQMRVVLVMLEGSCWASASPKFRVPSLPTVPLWLGKHNNNPRLRSKERLVLRNFANWEKRRKTTKHKLSMRMLRWPPLNKHQLPRLRSRHQTITMIWKSVFIRLMSENMIH